MYIREAKFLKKNTYLLTAEPAEVGEEIPF